ncbi:MAG TPA: cohesin domain-containing protein [Candidatus Limnocylindrales bacterium]|nr:cohesin domain-containing protein [Candidatus Limnocylindrales bacterium]
MKKSILALFLAIIALTGIAAINPSHAQTGTTIAIDSSTQQFPSATVGSTIQINIVINNVQDLWAWDVAGLMFNPAYLNLTSVSEGPFLKAAGQDLFIWTSDSFLSFSKGVIPDISDVLLSFTSESGSGVLATLTFTVLALGTSQINFNQTTLDTPTNVGTTSNPVYQTVTHTNINAVITVGSTTSQTPSPPPSNSPSSSPSPTDSTSASQSPSPTPKTQQAPEFPAISIVILLITAATASTLIISKKAKPTKR